jgi:hypothetical protein
MKYFLIPCIALVFFLTQCKKDQGQNNIETIPTDTSEYVSFRITGDSLNNEFVRIDTGMNRVTIYENASNNPHNPQLIRIRIQLGHSGSLFYVNAFFQTAGTKAGKYQFDSVITNNSTCSYIGIPFHKGGPVVKSKSGYIHIDHIPEDTSDFVTGTFEGVFENNYVNNPDVDFVITEGKFHIKKKS